MPTPKSLIFVVEDAPDQVAILSAYIKAEVPDAVIVAMGTIQETVQRLKSSQPNLLILDLHLTDGEGEDLLKAIAPQNHAFPILIATGDKSEETLKKMLDLGADDFVIKPVDDLIFNSKLRSLLSGRYVSPLSFQGRREGLGELQMSAPVELSHIDEKIIIFKSKFQVVKDATIYIQFAQIDLQVKVLSVQTSPTAGDLAQISGRVEFLDHKDCCKLRQVLFSMKNKVKSKAA